ncbi:hypothetical protein F5Y15DRAFT_23120 [Xylariaceae sp. FL0016]|nr:hypothetical protein F5Y15DRAFT_23120 [Xylariaceae sp. FL0016]
MVQDGSPLVFRSGQVEKEERERRAQAQDFVCGGLGFTGIVGRRWLLRLPVRSQARPVVVSRNELQASSLRLRRLLRYFEPAVAQVESVCIRQITNRCKRNPQLNDRVGQDQVSPFVAVIFLPPVFAVWLYGTFFSLKRSSESHVHSSIELPVLSATRAPGLTGQCPLNIVQYECNTKEWSIKHGHIIGLVADSRPSKQKAGAPKHATQEG